MSFAFNEENRRKFDDLVRRYPKKVAATLPALWLTQKQEGCLPMASFDYLAQLLDSTPTEIYSVATFYTMFHIGEPAGTHHIQVCKTLSCMLNGRDELLRVIKEELDIAPGEKSEDGRFSCTTVECMGACGGAPMICVNERYHEYLTPQSLRDLLRELR